MNRKNKILIHWNNLNRQAGRQTNGDLVLSILEGPSNRLLQAGYKQWIGTGYKRILDVGSGLGRWALYFSRISPLSQIHAVDFTPEAIGRMKMLLSKQALPISYCCADAFHLPFPKHSFDLVHSFGLIEDYPNYFDLLSEQMRVLIPGGRLICVTLHCNSWHALYKRLLGNRYYSFTDFEHDFSAKQLMDVFQQLSLQNIEVSYAEPMHRIAAVCPWKFCHWIEIGLKRIDFYLEHLINIPIARYWSHDIYIKGDKPY
jgi:ubiquinone/menaquinone biosynthesis C-methylase UbiE